MRTTMMQQQPSVTYFVTAGLLASFLGLCLHVGSIVAAAQHDEHVLSQRQSTPAKRFTVESIRGKVVWMADALKQQFGINLMPDAQDRLLALRSPDGKLYPIMEDLRGRSFRTDKRLREIDVELLVRRYAGSPMVQVIRIYEYRKDGNYIVDYWCDICAIVMFETGPCACCQDHNRLRKRPAATHQP